MLIIDNHGDPVTLSVGKTKDVSYTGGVCKLQKGARILVTAPGVIKVKYRHDAEGVYRLRKFNTADEWQSDNIEEIIQEGTEVDAASILIGW